jgi:hypothetical protein
VSIAVGVLVPTVWAVAAYRPETYSSDIVLMLNDAGWFLVLFTWPPFSMWCIAVAAAILRDESVDPVFPRWAGYLSISAAFLLVAAACMAFAKTGPLAYNGLIALYVPVAWFLVWMVAMSILAIRAVTRLSRQARAGEPVRTLPSDASAVS